MSVPFANAARVTNTSEQGKTARQVIVASETAMKDVKSFHVVGMVGGKSTASSFSLSLSATGGGGEVSVPGATLKLVVAAGTVYIKANEASWLKLTGSRSTAQLVANRWIKAPASNTDFSNFAALTITTDFVAEFFPGAATHISEAAGTTTWHREKAILLTDPRGRQVVRRGDRSPRTCCTSKEKARRTRSRSVNSGTRNYRQCPPTRSASRAPEIT